jgi:hypothetical protein
MRIIDWMGERTRAKKRAQRFSLATTNHNNNNNKTKKTKKIYITSRKKKRIKEIGCALFPDADGHIQTRYKQQQHETIIDLFRSTFCLLPNT